MSLGSEASLARKAYSSGDIALGWRFDYSKFWCPKCLVISARVLSWRPLLKTSKSFNLSSGISYICSLAKSKFFLKKTVQ